MKLFILLLITINLVSCSVKSDGEETVQEVSTTDELSASSDSDGDLMNDKEEANYGRNPFIADLPDIRVRFLQNYKITVHYKDLLTEVEGEFVIDTKVGANDPSFKYRVGNVFLRENSYKTAASIGKFANHSWGGYRDHDLSWVKYPDIDQKFFQENVMKYSKFFNNEKYKVTNVQVELENSIKLKANTDYKEIVNPELSFRFYNYESEKFEIIHSVKIEKTIVSGVNETLTVKIENVNPKLISENYFKKGEFIISEMTNYEIPKIKTDYFTLLNSVKNKTVPVVYNTPLETEVRYVSAGSGIKINKILEILFGKKYVVKNEKVTTINQFKNNLPDYTYLNELRTHDKKGSWFVFTNRLNKHYLEHDFTNKDVLSLSYILGKDLASQVEEKIFSYSHEVETTEHYQSYVLGNIQPNSEVSFFLESKRLFGEKIKHWKDSFSNRTSRCDVEFNIFSSLDEKLTFNKEFLGAISRIDLSINGDNYKLIELINAKKVRLTWTALGVSIHIANINTIKEMSNTEENLLSLKLYALRESHFNGVKLTGMSGRTYYFCPRHTTFLAGSNNWPLSVESKDFSQWAGTVKWDLVQRGERKNLVEMFSVGITSIISNFHN
jgi:hypothetical protein